MHPLFGPDQLDSSGRTGVFIRWKEQFSTCVGEMVENCCFFWVVSCSGRPPPKKLKKGGYFVVLGSTAVSGTVLGGKKKTFGVHKKSDWARLVHFGQATVLRSRGGLQILKERHDPSSSPNVGHITCRTLTDGPHHCGCRTYREMPGAATGWQPAKVPTAGETAAPLHFFFPDFGWLELFTLPGTGPLNTCCQTGS